MVPIFNLIKYFCTGIFQPKVIPLSYGSYSHVSVQSSGNMVLIMQTTTSSGMNLERLPFRL
ncbi:hypothetical protein MTR_2g039310 [Medicago truncatula]|uniref:Uncharacterized protein n=1 Tax=Medicago truncatula TaxID=3880 RepID=G7III4_MEDTR|nr:hypothetical protein MTR_2g039310 [Medicago truncatula]